MFTLWTRYATSRLVRAYRDEVDTKTVTSCWSLLVLDVATLQYIVMAINMTPHVEIVVPSREMVISRFSRRFVPLRRPVDCCRKSCERWSDSFFFFWARLVSRTPAPAYTRQVVGAVFLGTGSKWKRRNTIILLKIFITLDFS